MIRIYTRNHVASIYCGQFCIRKFIIMKKSHAINYSARNDGKQSTVNRLLLKRCVRATVCLFLFLFFFYLQMVSWWMGSHTAHTNENILYSERERTKYVAKKQTLIQKQPVSSTATPAFFSALMLFLCVEHFPRRNILIIFSFRLFCISLSYFVGPGFFWNAMCVCYRTISIRFARINK